MKKTLLLVLSVALCLTFSCKKDSEKQEVNKLKVYLMPNSTGNTAYYVLVSIEATNQTGQKVLSLKDVKPSKSPFISDVDVKSGDVLNIKYNSSHNEASYIDFEVRWGETMLYSSYNHNLEGKTGNTITVKAP